MLYLLDIMKILLLRHGMNGLLSTNQYIYLGIPFNESLDLELIIVKMNDKINYTNNSFYRFLTDRNVPFYFKTWIIVSFVHILVLYYVPLLGLNKKITENAQSALNRGLFWSFGFKNKTSNTTIYNMSKELFITFIGSFCAKVMIRRFKKWKVSYCIIFYL